MKRILTHLIKVLIVPGLLACTGCFETAAVLSVKKDGSGDIASRTYMAPSLTGMMQGDAGGLFGGFDLDVEGDDDGAPAAAPAKKSNKERFTELAEKALAGMGEGVKLESVVEKKNAKGWEGFLAKYSFEDVNKLKFGLGTEGLGDMGGGNVKVGGGGKPGDDMAYSFEFKPGNEAVLKIIAAHKKEKEPEVVAEPDEFDGLLGDLDEGQEDNPAVAPAAEAANPMAAGMMAMMGPMLQGMRLTFMIKVDGIITETDSSYKIRDNVITVVDMPMDKLMSNPQAMPILMNDDGRQMERLGTLKIPGLKVSDAEKDLIIKFK